jgi:amino acid adenylation domain-containing protein
MEPFTLTNIIENSAIKYPDKEAFKCGNDSISFLELDVKTNQLAKYLSDSGVKKGDKVGVYLNRSLETAIAIYGILKAGAAYVPLDFTAPHTRTIALITNCDIQFLISSSKLKSKLKSIVNYNSSLKEIIGLSEELSISTTPWEEIFKIDLNHYIPVKIVEQDLAYIMFTSGSTGTPKGIMHTHNSGLIYAKLSSELYSVVASDIVGNHAPIHFDISTFGYFTAPLAGASTVIVTDAHTKLPNSLAQLIAVEKLTIWYSVPLALIQMLQTGILDNLDISSLRWVLFGGEVFPLKYLKELLNKLPKTKFSNVYGPAEVNQCTYYNFDASIELIQQLPIGQVWRNTDFKILSEDDTPVNKGEKGQLVIRSGTMMRGYWKNKTLTENAFFYEKLKSGEVLTFYRTGDVVYEHEDGVLYFSGRQDRQVKLRGYRIELDEIESVMLKHPDVKQAAVVINKEEDIPVIYAAIMLMPEAKSNIKDIKLHCKTHLPLYAVPNSIEILDDLPKTSSGKIDRKILVKNQ